MRKTVFHVSRATKTGRTVNVGDYDTKVQALAAMFRETCLVGGTYYKKFMPDELKKLAESEGC